MHYVEDGGAQRILMVGSFPPLVAGECVSNQELYVYLSSKYKVHLLNTCLESSPKSPGELSLKKIGSLLWKWLQAYNVLLVDYIYITPGLSYFGFIKALPFLVSGLLLRKQIVLHYHGSLFPKTFCKMSGFEKYVVRGLLKSIKSNIVLTHSLKNEYIETIGIKNIVVVNNFYQVDSQPVSLEKPPITSGINVLFLSNLIPEKGIYETIRAVSALYEAGYNIHLDICGALPSGDKDRFRKELDASASCISFHGMVRESKHEVLGRSHFFILPTYYPVEGVPLSLLESMAAGLIPIVTPINSIIESIDISNVLLVEPKSVQSIVDTLREALDDPQRLAKMGSANSRFARERYSLDKFTGAIERALLG